MGRVTWRLPSPAMVVALVALAVALGGTGYAATSLSRPATGAAAKKKTAKRTNDNKQDIGLLTAFFNSNKASLRGAVGPAGAQGQQGPQGPQGSTGVVSVGTWAGQVGVIPANSGIVFAGPTATLTTTATQRVLASGSAALATGTGSVSFQLGICKQPSAGGTISILNLNPTAYDSVLATTTRIPFAMSDSGVPGAGTWNIGICVASPLSSQAINNNDQSIGWAIVTN